MISGDLVSERGRVGNADGASMHLDEAGSVETAKVPRNEFPHGPKSSGEFFIVFREFELNSVWCPLACVFRQSQEVRDQTPPNGRERQFFNQTHQVPKPVTENFEDFESEFGTLQADSSEIISR